MLKSEDSMALKSHNSPIQSLEHCKRNKKQRPCVNKQQVNGSHLLSVELSPLHVLISLTPKSLIFISKNWSLWNLQANQQKKPWLGRLELKQKLGLELKPFGKLWLKIWDLSFQSLCLTLWKKSSSFMEMVALALSCSSILAVVSSSSILPHLLYWLFCRAKETFRSYFLLRFMSTCVVSSRRVFKLRSLYMFRSHVKLSTHPKI